MAIEIVHCGNGRAALHAIGLARRPARSDRVILGNDAPSGTGVVPLGILRTMAHLASLGGIAPEVAVAWPPATPRGSTGSRPGRSRSGREADIALVDAPQGSAADSALGALAIGDLPGVAMILIDGKPVVGRSRNTPPAGRAPEVVKGPGIGGGGH